MRHGDKINNLSRTASHRKALLSNLASQLITHKRIITTVAKAKSLRVYVEPLITKAKENTTHQHRVVFSYLQDKDAVKELFGPVAEKVAGRPGGYTRIIKLGARIGDNAETALIELVDFNEVYGKTAETKTESGKRTRRAGSRRRSTSPETAAPLASEPASTTTDIAPAEVVSTTINTTPVIPEAPLTDESTDEKPA